MQYTRFLSGIQWHKVAPLIVVCLFFPQVHAEESLQTDTFTYPRHPAPPSLDGVVFLDRGSTLGFGIETTKGVSPKVDVRTGFDQLRGIDRRKEPDMDYRLKEKLRSGSFLFDWHPFGGSFRTSIGVLINRHTLQQGSEAGGKVSADSIPAQ